MSFLRSLAQGQGGKLPEYLETADFSKDLSEKSAWGDSFVADLALPGEVCVMAAEPVQGYFAVGTVAGTIHVFGSPAVSFTIRLKPALKVKNLFFKPGSSLLCCIDAKDSLAVYDLTYVDPATSLPVRTAVHSLRNVVTCVEVSPSHSHVFVGFKDGTIDAYDLDRHVVSPYKIPNLWWEEEEILRKSGVPGAPTRRHIPMVIEARVRPNDINQMLIAYEGGVVLLDIKRKIQLKTYQLRIMPGAIGGGNDPNVFTERSPAVTCIAWRPDGEVFVVGYEDGCLAFWATEEEEKPLLVRTLELGEKGLDVNKPGHLAVDASGNLEYPGGPVREPIFKVAWSAFPAETWFTTAATAAQGFSRAQDTDSSGAADQTAAPESTPSGTILTVLGGTLVTAPAGITCLHFLPHAASVFSMSNPLEIHKALRASVERFSTKDTHNETGMTHYQTSTPVEDFCLMPRSNPHYSMAYDPVAIVALLAPEPDLPPMPPPAPSRGLRAWRFPQRARPSTDPSSPENSGRVMQPPTQQSLLLPASLQWTGAGALLGLSVHTVSPAGYRSLLSGLSAPPGAGSLEMSFGESQLLANDALEAASVPDPLPLHGGHASANLRGDGHDDADRLARLSPRRILVTWHLDSTVRFWDVSPQLLLVAEPIGVYDKGKRPEQQAQADLEGDEEKPQVHLQRPFPCPLPHLTISLRGLLIHSPPPPSPQPHPIYNRFKTNPQRLKIENVKFSPEALEAVIILRSGEVGVWRFGKARASEALAHAEGQFSPAQGVSPRTQWTSPDSSPMGMDEQASEAMDSLDNEMVAALKEMSTDQPNSRLQSGGTPDPGAMLASESERGSFHSTRLMVRDDGNSDSSSAREGSSNKSGAGPPPRPPRNPLHRLSKIRSSGESKRQESSKRLSARGPPIPSHAEEGRMGIPAPIGGGSGGGAIGGSEEIEDISWAARWDTDGFKPFCFIDLRRGEIEAIESSDVGFLALAAGSALYIVDFRGPEVLLREDPASAATSAADAGPYATLTFAICRLTPPDPSGGKSRDSTSAVDASLGLRLVAVRKGGTTALYTLSQTLGQWVVTHHTDPKGKESWSNPDMKNPIASFVVDSDGRECRADRVSLQEAQREHESMMFGRDQQVALWIGVAEGAVTIRSGIAGPRAAKLELSALDTVKHASLISRHGSHVLAVFDARGSSWILSLPQLERVARQSNGLRDGNVYKPSMDKDSGELFEYRGPLDVQLRVFSVKRAAGMPRLRLYSPRPIPAQPARFTVATSMISSWWGGANANATNTTGEELDAVLAGPDRPPPPQPPVIQGLASSPPPRVRPARRQDSSASASREASTSRRTEATREQLRMNVDALEERGETMKYLEDGLQSLEKGASDFVAKTKKFTAMNAAKGTGKWFL